MMVAGYSLAVVAALLHVFIFYLESLAWTTSRARSIFGLSKPQAESTKEMAFNQGFYNLFLAIEVLVAVVLLAVPSLSVAGLALAIAGLASMFCAAAVRWVSSPDKRSAAVKQGVFPLLALLLLIFGSLV